MVPAQRQGAPAAPPSELGAPIVRIALTHAHGDHIGSLDELAAALPGVEVLISARDARLLHKDMSLDPGEPQRKLRGSYPGAKTRPTRTLAAGDTRRLARGRRGAGPHARPRRLPRHAATARCCAATRTRRSAASPRPRRPPALPAGRAWRRGTAATELESARALRALEPAGWLRATASIVEAPARRDGRGDREGAPEPMPRAGLDTERVVDAAARDRRRRGARRGDAGARRRRARRARRRRSTTTSTGATGCCARVALLGAARARPPRCATRPSGASGADALAATARAYRAYARAHPGRYAAGVRAPAPDDAEHQAAAAEAVEVVYAVLRGWQLRGRRRRPRRARVPQRRPRLRAARGGGGFGIPVDVDTSFERLVATLAGGLATGR